MSSTITVVLLRHALDLLQCLVHYILNYLVLLLRTCGYCLLIVGTISVHSCPEPSLTHVTPSGDLRQRRFGSLTRYLLRDPSLMVDALALLALRP